MPHGTPSHRAPNAPLPADLIALLDCRVTVPAHCALLEAFLADIPFPPAARVLDVGSGTGTTPRLLATWPRVAEVVAGMPSMLADTGRRQRGHPWTPASVDVVLCHMVLSHLEAAGQVMAASFQLLRPGGIVAVCDGTYDVEWMQGTEDPDPLQACLDAWHLACARDPVGMYQLPLLAKRAGFQALRHRHYGTVPASMPTGLLLAVTRGGEALVSAGRIGAPLATALLHEAQRRVAAGNAWGQLIYTGLFGRKPGQRQAA